jgi:GDP-L-fucose synthase
MIQAKDKVYVAGHRGLVGSGIVRELQRRGCNNIVTRTHSELDLINQADVNNFLSEEQPDYVIIAAAKVGGIYSNNTYPADFIYGNLMVECNLIHGSYSAGINNLLFLGSSCIYPKYCKQPMKEEYLLTGELEKTNEPYAVAKIAGIKLCESYNRQYNTNFRSVMPTNLYGINDNFHLENSHVVPALIRKFHDAKCTGLREVEIWGTGNSKREFLYIDDMADACLHLINIDDDLYHKVVSQESSYVNIGCGSDITIKNLAILIKKIVNYKGNIVFNEDMPDGTPRKLLDTSRLKSLGWEPEISLETGLTSTYDWFLDNIDNFRK